MSSFQYEDLRKGAGRSGRQDAERSRYKYKLKGGDYRYSLPECFAGFAGNTTNVKPPEQPYVRVKGQLLIIRDGYEWNGANHFPDFKSWFLRATMVHDALCQLLGEGTWESADETKDKRDFRRCADRELYCITGSDGGPIRAKLIYFAVRGYAKAGLLGGAAGGLAGLFRKRPTFACGAEVPASDSAA